MISHNKIEWVRLGLASEKVGRLAIYKSSDSTDLPVRAVDRKWDNKADPNLETGTWGLFSTCMPSIRKGIVDRGDHYLFFFTSRDDGNREVMGYYELGWYVVTGFQVRDRRGPLSFPDFAIRAKKIHFVEEGLPMKSSRHRASKIRERLEGDALIGYGPRHSTPLSASLTIQIRNWLDRYPDRTSAYIKEIRALEEENLRRSRYRYPSWERVEGFEQKHMVNFVK